MQLSARGPSNSWDTCGLCAPLPWDRPYNPMQRPAPGLLELPSLHARAKVRGVYSTPIPYPEVEPVPRGPLWNLGEARSLPEITPLAWFLCLPTLCSSFPLL